MSESTTVVHEVNMKADEVGKRLVVQKGGEIMIRDEEIRQLLASQKPMVAGQALAGIRITINIS